MNVKPRIHKRKPGKDHYIAGFLAGQTTAYCDQICRGSRLIAQIALPRRYLKGLLIIVAQQGCKATAEPVNTERLSLWIYQEDGAKRLVDALASAPPSALGMWSMGKLFGYADREVVNFVERST